MNAELEDKLYAVTYLQTMLELEGEIWRLIHEKSIRAEEDGLKVEAAVYDKAAFDQITRIGVTARQLIEATDKLKED